MAGHQLDLLGRELVGHRHRLLRIAGVVADIQHKLLTQHAAGLVQVGHRLFRAGLHLVAERGIFAGHRPGGGDMDLRPRRHRRAGQCNGKSCRGSQQAYRRLDCMDLFSIEHPRLADAVQRTAREA